MARASTPGHETSTHEMLIKAGSTMMKADTIAMSICSINNIRAKSRNHLFCHLAGVSSSNLGLQEVSVSQAAQQRAHQWTGAAALLPSAKHMS